MNVSIQMVPPAEMRYQTVGDWQVKGNTLIVKVARSGDARTDMLVAIHELCEAFTFLENGGHELDVDRFDKGWKSKVYNEAGDDPKAPYHEEHVLATIIERLLAAQIAMPWEQHDENVEHTDRAVRRARRSTSKPHRRRVHDGSPPHLRRRR